jgi:phosphatidate cytidylyltransferase
MGKTNFFLRLFTTIALIILSLQLYTSVNHYMLTIFLFICSLYILFHEWPKFSLLYLTPIYPVIPLLIIIILSIKPYTHIFLFLLFVNFSCDIGAYLVGSICGKHIINHHISPKKTYEGLVGGIILSYISSYFLYSTLSLKIPLYIYSSIVFTISILACMGDFFESWLKRKAKLKDSGVILPGHGGLLDRIDSLLFSAFFIFAIKTYLLYYF